jgi:ubiquinone/menaquinone biosynthesis C-methylase UbiE
MVNDRGRWLWNLMALFYDQFYTRFPPYQKLILDITRNLPDPKLSPVSVLDAGCGTGLISLNLAKHRFRVVGFDRSKEMLKQAIKKKIKYPELDLRFEEGDLDRPGDPPSESFHAVLFIHSLYLLDNPKETLKIISNRLSLGGDLILCNPVRSITRKELWQGGIYSLREILNKKDVLSIFYLLPIIISMGLLNVIIQRKKQKSTFHCWTPEEMKAMLDECGFKVKWTGYSCLGGSHLLVCASRNAK